MSEDLKLFYREYALWLKTGAEEHLCFSRGFGLCTSLLRWCVVNDVAETIFGEMIEQFINAGLDEDIPFNSLFTEERRYTEETSSDEAHLNEKRRKWVFDHAE